MTRLDQSSKGAARPTCRALVSEVRNLAIWGNHSSTQYPDFGNATIGSKPAREVIGDDDGCVASSSRPSSNVAPRSSGAGASSAASAANAAADSARSIFNPTSRGDNDALAVIPGANTTSRGTPVRVPRLQHGNGWDVVTGFELDEFAKEKIQITTDELLEEREAVADLLPN